MKADLSRQTFDPKKRYSSVLMQQGRVQLDAEWNEQQEIHQHRAQTGARDVIGARGTPIDHDGGATGFEITARDGTLFIGEGHIYVDGILCVNEGEEQLSYEEQPDLPSAEDLRGWMDGVESEEADLKPGLVFLDVWERHVTHLDDDRIREVALGGPDTTTRKQTVWQTKVMALDPEKDDAELLARYAELRAKSEPSEAEEAELEEISPQAVEVLNALCERGEAALDELGEPPTGNLSARAEEESGAIGPCEIPPGGGYERLENQLYRVEVHRSGNRGTARFKWSRDNGCVATGIEEVDVGNKEITVKDTGRDEFLSFANGQWVEVVDDDTELRGEYRMLLQIDEPVDHARRVITVRQTPPSIDPSLHPKLRRWDQQVGATENGIELQDDWTELEDGIEVKIMSGQYRAGDYWLIPARTATGDVEWPRADPEVPNSGPDTLPPHGVGHSFCALAIVAAMPDGDSEENRLTVLHDCRHLFPQLTNLTGFFYLGGDGQEAMPGKELPEPLRVGVANGQWPVQGARVEFEVLDSEGSLTSEDGSITGEIDGKNLIVLTNADGIASCRWTLDEDTNKLGQRVRATLLDVEDETLHLPVNFNANLSVASHVAYEPGACATLSKANTVQQALEGLSNLSSLYYVSGDAQEVMPADRDKLEPLQVMVANECGPVKGAKVEFKVLDGGGQLSPEDPTEDPSAIPTDEHGIASCHWTLGPTVTTQRATATLQSAANNPIHEPLTVHFIANLSVATQVALEKTDNLCELLRDPEVNTVQDALDALCRADVGAGGCEVTVGEGGQYGRLEEALEALGDRSNICIRMLSGDHEIPEGLTISERANVRIEGCTPGTRLFLGDRLILDSLASFALRDIEILARDMEVPIEINRCGEVTLDSCYLLGIAEPDRFALSGLLTVGGAHRIRLENNLIEALPARPAIPFEVFERVDGEVARLFEEHLRREEFRRRALDIAHMLSELDNRPEFARQVRQSASEVQDRLGFGQFQSYDRFAQILEFEVDRALLVDRLRGRLEDIRNTSARASFGTAVVIRDAAADTVLHGNGIIGVVSLYGAPGETQLTDQLSTLGEDVYYGGVPFPSSAATLQVHNNKLTRVVVAEDVVERINRLAERDETVESSAEIYGESFFSNNVVALPRNHVVSREVSMASNAFKNFPKEDSSDSDLLCTVIGTTPVFTGNQADRYFNEIISVCVGSAFAANANIEITVHNGSH